MSKRRATTASADRTRAVPASEAGKVDRIEAALASLDAEERRLMRLGFEAPLQRCREERRYWKFLQALFSMPRTSRRGSH